MKSILNKLTPMTFMYLGWLVSLGGFLGSLVYSELLSLPPCDLCWYQRIALYPCVVIFGVGIISKDFRAAIYTLILSVIGFFIALYQVLLQAKIINEAIMPCKFGVSCSEVGFQLFGFLTIPQQSLLGFAAIIGCSFFVFNLRRLYLSYPHKS